MFCICDDDCASNGYKLSRHIILVVSVNFLTPTHKVQTSTGFKTRTNPVPAVLFLVLHLGCVCMCTEYCEKYAKPEDIGGVGEEKSSDEEVSEDEYSSDDEEMAGQADA